MPRVKIIHKYLFREMAGPFAVSLLVFTFMLLTAKIMELTDLVIERGMGLATVGKLLFYALPFFFVWTLPMATLLGVLLGFLRLSTDNEVTALRAAGVGLKQLLTPVALLALIAWLSCSALAIWAMPWGHNKFETLLFQVAHSQADLALKERAFLDSFPGLVIYVGRLPGEGRLMDVFIVDQRDEAKENTIIAKRGKFFPASAGKVTLRLYDGTIHAIGENMQSAQTASFETYDITMDAGGGMGSAPKRHNKHRKEMFVGELLAEMDKAPPGSTRYYLLDIELQQKFSLPFACFVMALIGIPLGVHTRAGRSWGVALALGVFLVYYLMLSAAWGFGESGAYPPKLGVWVPNLIFALVGIQLYRLEVQGRSIPILDGLEQVPRLMRRLRGEPNPQDGPHCQSEGTGP